MTHDDDFLAGGGELGTHIRAKDWSATPLGPASAWPQSLRTAVSILLNSRYPMFIFWGSRLLKIYNDGYRPILGDKHPWALGRPGPEVWPEIWDEIGPMVERVVRHGEATWSEDLRLFMHRRGFPEEVFFTFSYSPIRDESGGIGGMFCACTETTVKVLGERRLELLRDLAAGPAQARSVDDACRLSLEILRSDPEDIPFVQIDLDNPAALRPGLHRIADVDDPAVKRPHGPWPEPPHSVMVLPVQERGPDRSGGVILLAVSARLPFDESYRGFFELVAGQVAASIANARASEEERRRAEALAELDRAKTTFFSNVSHEFRTPLTLLLGPVDDALADSAEPLGPTQRERLTLVRRGGMRLQKLVNALLDFSRIEAGRAEARLVTTDVAALTRDLASGFRSAIERAGLRLVVDCPPLSAPAHVDPEMWEKVVLNLLSNALKFTFEGEIAVTLRERGDRFELAVGDTGTGIAAAELPHVFERFRRVEGARSRTHEGTGIGLALVHELIKLHGGSVHVDSAEGRGSTFIVSVPLGRPGLAAGVPAGSLAPGAGTSGAEAYVDEALRWLPDGIAADEPGALAARDAAPGPRRDRIVWADDNSDLREYVRRLLSSRYDVEPVADGRAALAAVRADRPDLVLADVMMPLLDGIQLVRAMRADPALQTIPVILLSARAGEESRIEGLSAGATDYLFKPFTARQLLAEVASKLERARMAREHEETLREASRRKDEFIATLSHELRNPLAPLRNSLHVLRSMDQPDPVVRSVHEMMERQVNHLVRLVDDLLESSRISHGTFELRPERVEVEAIVRNAIETSQPLIDEGGHRLEVALPAQAIWLRGDPVRLAQIVSNLLNNAAKYTPPGGHIRVEATRRADGAAIAVRDDGPGISKEALARVFDMFNRGDDRTGRGKEGLGIGLALSRRLAEMHGGTIEARSEGAGLGSEFTLVLPLAPAAEANADPAPAGAEESTPDESPTVALGERPGGRS